MLEPIYMFLWAFVWMPKMFRFLKKTNIHIFERVICKTIK